MRIARINIDRIYDLKDIVMAAFFTRKRIVAVNTILKRMLPEWRNSISRNITGVHFGKKETNGKRGRNFAIVFHVQRKLKYPTSQIPDSITLDIDGINKTVPTDVIETGVHSLLSIQPGDMARPAIAPESDHGTTGLFLQRNNLWYACSNMHVFAPQILSQGSYFLPIHQQVTTDVICYNNNQQVNGFLEKANFTSTDLAIARIQDQDSVDITIKGIGIPNGMLSGDEINQNIAIRSYGSVSGAMNGNVIQPCVQKWVQYDNYEAYISDLVATDLESDFGDSGSPVADDLVRIVGIIVSKDDYGTYVIPASDINAFVNSNP